MDIVSPTKTLCRNPEILFHPTRYDRKCVADRIDELVRATYALQCQHKALELRHASECHETAMCVLGRDHPLARLMEDDVDPVVRQETIELLTSSMPTLPRTTSQWMDSLTFLCCHIGKPRELAVLVEALWHSPVTQTERGTMWILWLCALSCLVFPLDESHPATHPLMESVICSLLHKTPPTSSFSPIQECVLTICFLVTNSESWGTLCVWERENPRNDRDIRLGALIDNISDNIALGRSDCFEQNDVMTRHSHKTGVASSSIRCTDQCH